VLLQQSKKAGTLVSPNYKPLTVPGYENYQTPILRGLPCRSFVFGRGLKSAGKKRMAAIIQWQGFKQWMETRWPRESLR